jgi:FtsP/CotA-like multicopper oxidase with cupredoxin domain
VAVHLHGGVIPCISDGGPFDWFGPLGTHGTSFLNNQTLNPLHLPGAAEYYYPMTQSARFIWYHDHAVGITRTNAYAGLATALLIRDKFEKGLVAQGLPNYVELGGNEIPLVFQDKIFVGPDTINQDPLWTSINLKPVTRKTGSLWYAHTYEANQYTGTGRWDLQPGVLTLLPEPSNIPEFFGDTMLVNGTAFPQATVQARRYRIRMLNACNARFLNENTDLTGGIDPTLLPNWGYNDSDAIYSAHPDWFKSKTLNEYSDEYGRLIQIIGNEQEIFGSLYFMPATYLSYPVSIPQGGVEATAENVNKGDTQVWEIYNVTGDVQPRVASQARHVRRRRNTGHYAPCHSRSFRCGS